MSLIEKIDTVMHQMGLHLNFVCDAYDRSLELPEHLRARFEEAARHPERRVPRPPMVRGAQVIENVDLPDDFDPPSASLTTPAPWSSECPVRCDDDCEVGRWHCAYVHEPRHKQAHDPVDCPEPC